MRFFTRSGVYSFGVTTTSGERLTVVPHDRAALAATALPGEADAAQLVAAERLGLFAYPDASDRDSVKGHAA